MPLLDQLAIGVPYLTAGIVLGVLLRDIRDAAAGPPREDEPHAETERPRPGAE